MTTKADVEQWISDQIDARMDKVQCYAVTACGKQAAPASRIEGSQIGLLEAILQILAQVNEEQISTIAQPNLDVFEAAIRGIVAEKPFLWVDRITEMLERLDHAAFLSDQEREFIEALGQINAIIETRLKSHRWA